MLNRTRLMIENPILCPSGFLGGSLLIARAFSSVEKYGAFVVSGRSGKEKNPKMAIGRVIIPSMMKTWVWCVNTHKPQNMRKFSLPISIPVSQRAHSWSYRSQSSSDPQTWFQPFRRQRKDQSASQSRAACTMSRLRTAYRCRLRLQWRPGRIEWRQVGWRCV